MADDGPGIVVLTVVARNGEAAGKAIHAAITADEDRPALVRMIAADDFDSILDSIRSLYSEDGVWSIRHQLESVR